MAGSRLLEALGSGRILVGDGAWGTELYRLGLGAEDCPELWCRARPDALRDLASGYLAAGADLVGTNSFGANRFRLARYGLESEARALNEAAARLSREAVDAWTAARAGSAAAPPEAVVPARGPAGPWVLGSMGPSGLRWGSVSPGALRSAFALQAEALASGGADALCVETAMDAREAALAVRAAVDATGRMAICSYSFVIGPGGEARTIAGQGLGDALEAALDAGASVVGANCGSGFVAMLAALGQMRIALAELGSAAPIAVSPNAGLPTRAPAIAAAVAEAAEGGELRYPERPEAMRGFAAAAFAEGASIVGGCCGTTPEHVRAIRSAADGR